MSGAENMRDVVAAAVAEAIAPLVARLDRMAQASAPIAADARSVTIPEASKTYSLSPRVLRGLWRRGAITGREIPGRGRSGKEIRISVVSIESYLRVKP
jgi:hypothetical protein